MVKKEKRVPEQHILDLGLGLIQEKGDNPSDLVVAPKVILASALFTTRNNNQKRAYIKNMPIAVAPGFGSLLYRGEELRYNDMEVWQVIIELARNKEIYKSGYVLNTSVYQILKVLKWPTGGHEYEIFQECLQRLKANSLTVMGESSAFIKAVSMISKFQIVEGREIQIHLDPEMYKLFQADRLALLSSDAIRNMPPLTRKVYEVIKTEVKQNLTVQNYMELSGNNYKYVRQFKPRLIAALKQLEAGGYIKGWSIDKKNVVYVQLLHQEDINQKDIFELIDIK